MKNKSLTIFFLLAFIFALPSYIMVALVSNGVLFTPDAVYPFISLVALAPIGAATVLSFKENRWRGVKTLWGRTFDFKRVARKKWFLPTFFLLPLLVFVAYPINLLLGQPLTEPLYPIAGIPVLFLVFFIGGLGEEVGWMGYAIEPMQSRWTALKAAILLGVIWAVWHIPIYIYLIVNPVEIVAQMVAIIAMRVIIVWLFNNSGKSVFVTIVFHAVYNVTMGAFPVNLVTTSFVLLISAVGITYLWGAETLTKFNRNNNANEYNKTYTTEL